ncbi:phage regulatory CII family protein [uncultured Bilophila sp.]|uniref:phage regulatory CII family protein n=1 Tax=uncultured Bilophila sp. TaxID=529385 RepID=UPI00266F545D|nr:phage regulatory CII family protein [uncultured Bilophila sp.]
MSKIIKSVHKLVTEGKMSAKSIATAVHKPYSTLLRETNPYDPGANLGVETFMDIIKATGDTRPLELMVHELGYRLTPVE